MTKRWRVRRSIHGWQVRFVQVSDEYIDVFIEGRCADAINTFDYAQGVTCSTNRDAFLGFVSEWITDVRQGTYGDNYLSDLYASA